MAVKKRRLGKGLDALLSSNNMELMSPSDGDRLNALAIDLIKQGQYQPRRNFDKKSLSDLADSIRSQGIVQPIVVRKSVDDNSYEIVAGERRWRAAQLAGLQDIPVIIKNVSDQTAMCIALIENIQRQDLNPLEEAEALSRLVDEFEMTHEALANVVGRSRSAVTNLLRLLDLDKEIKTLLINGELEMGHARSLLALGKQEQMAVAKQIIRQNLSVRQAESLIKRLQTKKTTQFQKKETADSNIRKLEEELSAKLGANVSIKKINKNKGVLSINYFSLDELDGIIKKIH